MIFTALGFVPLCPRLCAPPLLQPGPFWVRCLPVQSASADFLEPGLSLFALWSHIALDQAPGVWIPLTAGEGTFQMEERGRASLGSLRSQVPTASGGLLDGSGCSSLGACVWP